MTICIKIELLGRIVGCPRFTPDVRVHELRGSLSLLGIVRFAPRHFNCIAYDWSMEAFLVCHWTESGHSSIDVTWDIYSMIADDVISVF